MVDPWTKNSPTSATYVKDAPLIFQSNWTHLENILGVQHYTYSNAMSGRHKPGITPFIAGGSYASITALTGVNEGALAFDTTNGVMRRYSEAASAWEQINLFPQPVCSVWRSGDQNIATGSEYSTILFNQETFDPLSAFDSATNYRFTAPANGYYMVNIQATFAALTAGVRWKVVMALYNASDVLQHSSICECYSVDSNSNSMQNTFIIYMDRSEYIVFGIQHNSEEPTEVLEGGEDYTFAKIFKMS